MLMALERIRVMRFGWDLSRIYLVDILKGRYAGQYAVIPVNSGTNPISPIQDEAASPQPIIARPAKIRSIRSISPTF